MNAFLWQITFFSLWTLVCASSLPYDIFRHDEPSKKELHKEPLVLHDQIRRDEGSDSQLKSRFLTDKTKKFVSMAQDFLTWTLISESRLLPISKGHNESRELYFWFFPSVAKNPPNEILIWLAGGPGCSSLIGVLRSGPFTWLDGTYKPVPNAYDWRNLTNILFVEQPLGVGFTQGDVDITNEYQLTDEFIGFYEQFAEVFDVKGWDIYISGGSYSGYFNPYIANGFIQRGCELAEVKGVHINSALLAGISFQQNPVAKPFMDYWQQIFYINDTGAATLSQRHQDCGYADYLEKYFTFPAPQEKFPELKFSDDYNLIDGIGECDTDYFMRVLAYYSNPCYNDNRITDLCPLLWSVAGPLSSDFDTGPIYFNRTDVQKAIHAPVGWKWALCSGPVFKKQPNKNVTYTNDDSLGPAQNDVLRNVIEYTNNVIIGSGSLDSNIIKNGSLLALQNTTWNGYQGFKQYPNQNQFYSPWHPIYSEASQSISGIVGTWGEERGLTFFEVQKAGHGVVVDAPSASYRVIELLLGRIENLSQKGSFTTMPGNWTKA